MTDNAAIVTVSSLALLGIAYVTYGRFLARHIFQLDPHRKTPAHTLEDGVDYLPTRVPVLFGHHFASIAGLGPILGPAIAVIWGLGSGGDLGGCGVHLLGAIHDLGALTVSLRYQGRSIGDVCKQLIGGRARILFLLIIFFLMSLAMGAFVNAISSLFVVFRPTRLCHRSV
jgi:carbon starvation protein